MAGMARQYHQYVALLSLWRISAETLVGERSKAAVAYGGEAVNICERRSGENLYV